MSTVLLAFVLASLAGALVVWALGVPQPPREPEWLPCPLPRYEAMVLGQSTLTLEAIDAGLDSEIGPEPALVVIDEIVDFDEAEFDRVRKYFGGGEAE